MAGVDRGRVRSTARLDGMWAWDAEVRRSRKVCRWVVMRERHELAGEVRTSGVG